MAELSEHTRKQEGEDLGFERLVFFSDAVMAIAITLMALEIRLPELEPELAGEQIGAALQALLPHIGVYVLSFLVIGIYWVVHHRLFRLIRHYDVRLLWLNLIFLMTVAFVPVATNALGTYPALVPTTAFYAISIVVVGLSEFALWFYAMYKGFMAPPVEKHSYLYFALRIVIPPAVFLFSLLLAPFGSTYIQDSWVLMIPLLFVLRFIFPREHAERSVYSRGEV